MRKQAKAKTTVGQGLAQPPCRWPRASQSTLGSGASMRRLYCISAQLHLGLPMGAHVNASTHPPTHPPTHPTTHPKLYTNRMGKACSRAWGVGAHLTLGPGCGNFRRTTCGLHRESLSSIQWPGRGQGHSVRPSMSTSRTVPGRGPTARAQLPQPSRQEHGRGTPHGIVSAVCLLDCRGCMQRWWGVLRRGDPLSFRSGSSSSSPLPACPLPGHSLGCTRVSGKSWKGLPAWS